MNIDFQIKGKGYGIHFYLIEDYTKWNSFKNTCYRTNRAVLWAGLAKPIVLQRVRRKVRRRVATRWEWCSNGVLFLVSSWLIYFLAVTTFLYLDTFFYNLVFQPTLQFFLCQKRFKSLILLL